MHTEPLVLATLLTACGTRPAPDTAPADDVAPPAVWDYEDDRPSGTALTTDELTAAILEAARLATLYNGGAIFPAYREAMAGQTDACPTAYNVGDDEGWYSDCTSELGTTFEGHDHYRHVADRFDGISALYTGDYLYGVSTITTPEGWVFTNDGTISEFEFDANDGSFIGYESAVQGPYTYDGPAAEGTWLTLGDEPEHVLDLAIVAYTFPATGGHAFTIDGGISGLSAPAASVAFGRIALYDEAAGGVCGAEPGGAISVLDQDGGWYYVEFDGQSALGDAVDPALCDGCGEVTYESRTLGTVCLDLTGWNAWEDLPW